MPSNTNFGKYVLVALVSLGGCANTQRIHPSTDKLVSLRPDCRIAQQQLDWLRSIRPTYSEKIDARSQMLTYGGFSKEYQRNRDIVEGKIDWLIDLNIKDIYKQCQS